MGFIFLQFCFTFISDYKRVPDFTKTDRTEPEEMHLLQNEEGVQDIVATKEKHKNVYNMLLCLLRLT